MEVRDPIYGLIEYNKKEEKLINSSTFQRLRGIKQLALANLVYPGAHHTRFEHCIGTMHLAGRMAKKLKLDEEKFKILRLAGLLHDIGHGPFSHVSEQIMDKRIDKKMLKDYKAENAHELMSILLIQKDKEISKISCHEEIEEIVSLLKKQKRRSIEKDIISGPLDADKLDYLLRDSHFAGVKYGVFDLAKIVESLTPIEISTEETQLGISEEGIYAVEQLLLAKYHMNTQVYQHRIRRITDAMLIRGIEYAIEEIEDIRSLYTFQDTDDLDDFLEKYVKYDDAKLIDAILSNGNGTSFEYFDRIKKRKLLKEVLAVEIDPDNFPDSILLKNIMNMSEERRAIEDAAATLFSTSKGEIDSKLVIVDKQTTDNPTFKSPRVKIDTEIIMVEMLDGLRKDRIRKAFPESSAIFSNPAVGEKDTLYIYLPLDGIEDRTKIIGKNKNALLKIIEESCR
ncbi:MAG: HD domain-containing protein [Candidatus Syntrophoarchaeum sp.]|nr:HD domain-containing protein [Candidatus Syntrophoarchaeum sp.]